MKVTLCEMLLAQHGAPCAGVCALLGLRCAGDRFCACPALMGLKDVGKMAAL